MTSVRTRTCVAGAALAVLAGVLVDHGAVFGSDLPATALLGVAAGAVLGLVPHGGPALRAVGFLTGLLAAWLGYALRAGVLPDIPMGRALAAVAVVSLVTAVATATADRVPLWSGLLGAAALVGAYETVYTATPSAFAGESMTAVTTVLLAAAVGFVVAALVTEAGAAMAASTGAHSASEQPTTYDEVGLDEITRPAAHQPLPAPRVVDDAPAQSETNR